VFEGERARTKDNVSIPLDLLWRLSLVSPISPLFVASNSY
jgi:hypothetical protein